MYYLWTRLSSRHATPNLLPSIGAWLGRTPYKGTLLACWRADIGPPGDVVLLHAYADLDGLNHDRDTVAQSPERYGLGDALLGASTVAYRPFPFMDPVAAGEVGPFFEVRTYRLRVGAAPSVIETWRRSLPARSELSKPLLVMVSTDGDGPSMVHVWPYRSLDERHRIRQRAIETGVWPPKGGSPDTIVTQLSEIFLPAPFSPVR